MTSTRSFDSSPDTESKRGFWQRLAEAVDDASLSHAERLERRLQHLECEVKALQLSLNRSGTAARSAVPIAEPIR